MSVAGWDGPYTTEDAAVEACGSSDSDSDSGLPGNCPEGIPETLYLTYSCENCECRTTEVSMITGPTATGPLTHQWGMSANNCGADAGDHVLLTCVLGDDGINSFPGEWIFSHASGFSTATAYAISYDPLIVDFGQYTQQNCNDPGGPCTVTLTS